MNKDDRYPIWTKEQYDQFSQYVKQQDLKLACDILFYTGIRCGELFGLTVEDVLPDHSLIISKTYRTANGSGSFQGTKTPSCVRQVSIPAFLYDEIQEYLAGIDSFKPEDRLFHFTKPELSRVVRNCSAEAGLPCISVHGFRHSRILWNNLKS